MTKAELIEELHGRGETWANATYKKEYLENYLKGYDEARLMPMDELYLKIMSKARPQRMA